MQNKELRAIFSRYGELEENGIHTKLKGIYTHAYITYKKEKSIEVFYKKWSIWALKEYLHVLPLNLSDEKRKERQQWCAKINGLPLGTTARDLQQFIEEIGGAICFIPKQPNNYKPLKYAYIYFFTQEDMEIAINNVYEFKRKQLEWSPPEDKSCHLCGYTNHLAKECDNKFTTERKNYTNRKQLLAQMHNTEIDKTTEKDHMQILRPSQNCSQNWDESDMNEWGDEEEFFTDRELNNNNIKNGTAKGGSIHDKRANKNSNQADIVTIKTQINEIATLLKDFKEEQNNMKNEFSEIKQKFNTKPVNTGKQKQVTFNENNKRAKMDSSSSENDNNDTILKLQEKMDKQDSVQSTLFIVTHLGQSIFGDYKEM
uniref:RRM domain-containing protein n=1 Tax=Rhizophagus irregularis (strain DAOM 181602 / DAOM 197198 / MUCL 43194) TaxID=747089 RepID=U9TH42_RHIID